MSLHASSTLLSVCARLNKPASVPAENGDLYIWGVVVPPIDLDAVKAQPERRVACVRHRSAACGC
eukprot:8204897-Alexandrium_andersonii.AAC.1